MQNKELSNEEKGNGTTPLVSGSSLVVLWRTCDSEKTDRIMKQHGFIPKYDKSYDVDRCNSLCGRFIQIDDEGMAMKMDEMWEDGSELLNENNVCKNCLRVFRKHYC